VAASLLHAAGGHARLRRSSAARGRACSTSSSIPASAARRQPTRRTRRAWPASSTTCGACSRT
jgi:hypothetical protein